MFEPHKPDFSSYSHFFGNFGPGRPGGTDHAAFDNGTSAATPVAAGVGALLMSALGPISPALVKDALIAGASDIGLPGWDEDTGHGVLNAAASYRYLLAQ
jgi:subtilisin family serine protease